MIKTTQKKKSNSCQKLTTRTFHCRVRVLLVRWESFGVNGTSGTLQCVVNDPASEHDPRTELYVAKTLQKNPNMNTFFFPNDFVA